ncbi:MAG TPA: alpha-amylase family glycosyl hydrolase [Steroidobacteraceae bacterium]|nr:alpha-amylase family glycosyl hydrolase [Steroidobacteraceae bacterium]
MFDPQPADLAWWQRAVIYQIYPRSFQDSNGDGIGDLPGVLSRLDHLSELGVDAVWLSPVQPSPMRDFGYDIADYLGVDPLFGTMSDLDRLIMALHERGIRLIMDFVPNHTSDQHPWFVESRSARRNAKRDWYVWHDPAPDGGPPNNWLSRFGGSAWTCDERTGQYYYHAFLKEQPDLNWRNPEVRHAMADVLRFWLKRGVDGFRVDASAVLAEDALLRNDPPHPDWDPSLPPPERLKRTFTDDRNETRGYLVDLRAVVDEFPDRVLLGEVQGATERIWRFYSWRGRPIFHLPLNYALLDTRWDVDSLAATLDEYLSALPDASWPDWIVGGHDKSRIASRIGPARARVAAMLLFTLPGTPILFAGDEIGMRDVPVAPHQVQDPFERLVPGYGLNRDPERAPMRWDGTRHAGFTSGTPWLPVGDDVAELNVSVQRNEPRSMLALYRKLIRLRRERLELSAGSFEPARSVGNAVRYARRYGAKKVWVALNVGDEAQSVPLEHATHVLVSTYLDRSDVCTGGKLELRPHEGVVCDAGSPV